MNPAQKFFIFVGGTMLIIVLSTLAMNYFYTPEPTNQADVEIARLQANKEVEIAKIKAERVAQYIDCTERLAKTVPPTMAADQPGNYRDLLAQVCN